MLPLSNIIVKLFLTWQKSCFRTSLLPALKLKKETSHKLAKKLKLFSNPPSAWHECMTGGVASSMKNLPCTIWTLSPPICLPATIVVSVHVPYKLINSARLLINYICAPFAPLLFLGLLKVISQSCEGTDAAESPLLSVLEELFQRLFIPPCVWWVRTGMWVAGQSFHVGEYLSEGTLALLQICTSALQD